VALAFDLERLLPPSPSSPVSLRFDCSFGIRVQL
jgi:hypothetical protein